MKGANVEETDGVGELLVRSDLLRYLLSLCSTCSSVAVFGGSSGSSGWSGSLSLGFRMASLTAEVC